MGAGRQSDSQWQCVVYVTPNLDVFIDECQEFKYSQGLPTRQMLKQIISCGIRGRD